MRKGAVLPTAAPAKYNLGAANLHVNLSQQVRADPLGQQKLTPQMFPCPKESSEAEIPLWDAVDTNHTFHR